MQTIRISTEIMVYAPNELDEQSRQLLSLAKEATNRSYAVYSHFRVGAAVLLANGVIVTGNNQENVAYPSGLCAERTALFYANSQYPDVEVEAIAIVTSDMETVISPCGACRQVMLETEKRFGKPIRILMGGANEVYVAESVTDLLPLAFVSL
ncbi:MAG: cytidine deaminase [Bacteroides sp.]|nr:cytidine deaminase [Bacteroides sp.]